jgi:hypothetical protein
MTTMKRAIGRTGLAILMALGTSSAALASGASLGFALSTEIVQQRKDVDEVARPLPPSGPANRFCSPGQPICP